MKLRPYQREAVDAIAGSLAEGGIGQLHAACGSGKSLMGQQSALRLLPAGGTVAVMVPSLALVAQTISTWRALHSAAMPLDVLAVCSDDTVTDAPAYLPDIPAHVTTAPGEITDWLTRPATGGIRLAVCTYISAPRLREALHAASTRLDLLPLDEAHHLTGHPEPVIRRITEPAYIPAVRRLYMTATPRVDAAAADRSGFLSMDDTAIFGPVLYSYPFARGIAEGYLEDYRLFVVGIRESEVRALLDDKEREYVEGPGAPSLQTLVAQAALVRAAQKYGVRRAVSFHHRVEQAAEFARTLPATARRLAPERPAPTSFAIHGDMSHHVRELILDDLRNPPDGGWTVVSNARVLGEGVDIPAIDAVLFAHPKSSAVDIVQAVGRALRPHPDTPGPSTVIVPLIVPEQDGEIGDLEPGDYKTLWEVVRALRAHDEPLGIALDHQRSHASGSNPGLPDKITVELPPGTSQDVLTQVQLMLVRQTTSPWWEGVGEASAFRDEHGHLDVPTKHVTASGHRLGQWIINARHRHRKGWLPADRVAALDRLGMIWDRDQHHFDTTLAHARTYREQHGHLAVPQAYRTADGYRLGLRINVLRTTYAAGRLAPERIAALEEIGMIWHTRDQANAELIARARAYREQHGHLRVHHAYVTDDGYTLGSILKARRVGHARGTVPADVVRALDELGMVWDALEARFADGLAACVRYQERHGDLAVPKTYTDPEGYNLGDFIARQRSLNAGGTMIPKRRAALDELGMVWRAAPPEGRPPTAEEIAALRALPAQRGAPPASAVLALVDAGVQQKALAQALDITPSALSSRLKRARNAPAVAPGAFATRLVQARAYHAAHGHLQPPPVNGTEDGALAAWLTTQRRSRREGQLTDQQIAALDELGMEWDPLEARWQHSLRAARTYYEEHGHLRPPTGTVIDGTDLPAWLIKQRTAYRRGTLAPDRAAALDELGIVWNPSSGKADIRVDETWQNRLAEARAYREQHGHLRPSAATDGRRLHAWLCVQRSRRRNGKLSGRQINALDELGMHWG